MPRRRRRAASEKQAAAGTSAAADARRVRFRRQRVLGGSARRRGAVPGYGHRRGGGAERNRVGDKRIGASARRCELACAATPGRPNGGPGRRRASSRSSPTRRPRLEDDRLEAGRRRGRRRGRPRSRRRSTGRFERKSCARAGRRDAAAVDARAQAERAKSRSAAHSARRPCLKSAEFSRAVALSAPAAWKPALTRPRPRRACVRASPHAARREDAPAPLAATATPRRGRRDGKPARDVVRLAGWDQRELGEVGERRVGRRVERPVAADEHPRRPPAAAPRQRVPELGLAVRHAHARAGAELLRAGGQLAAVRPGSSIPLACPLSTKSRALVASVTDVSARGLRSPLDRTAPGFETPWLTAVFVVLSAWWVKGPMLIGLGLASDVWRRRLPLAFLAAGAAWLVTSCVVDALKEVRPCATARGRPGAPGRSSRCRRTPRSPPATAPRRSPPRPPSRSSAQAPRLGAALAAGVALSRVYLRVHFPIDVLAGAALGAAVGALFAATAIAVLRRRPATTRTRPDRAGRVPRSVVSAMSFTSVASSTEFEALYLKSVPPVGKLVKHLLDFLLGMTEDRRPTAARRPANEHASACSVRRPHAARRAR